MANFGDTVRGIKDTVTNNRGRVISALAKAKNKVIDKTSDILSHPVRYYHDGKSRLADKRYSAYKMVNDSKGKPDGGNERDPLFRARASMKQAQLDALQKAQK